jgi:hypothetical protein
MCISIWTASEAAFLRFESSFALALMWSYSWQPLVASSSSSRPAATSGVRYKEETERVMPLINDGAWACGPLWQWMALLLHRRWLCVSSDNLNTQRLLEILLVLDIYREASVCMVSVQIWGSRVTRVVRRTASLVRLFKTAATSSSRSDCPGPGIFYSIGGVSAHCEAGYRMVLHVVDGPAALLPARFDPRLSARMEQVRTITRFWHERGGGSCLGANRTAPFASLNIRNINYE